MSLASLVVDSRVEAVTVYSRGAMITRVAEVEPRDGAFPEAVRFAGLPLSADDASFRVRVDASGGKNPTAPALLARDLRIALEVPEAATAELEPDERELEETRKEEAWLKLLVEQAEREVARLGRLSFSGRPAGKEGEPPGPSPSAARLALLEFRARRSQGLTDRLLELREKARRAEERRRELADRRRRASNARRVEPHALRKAVVVTLDHEDDAVTEGAARLVLEYLVPGARWSPGYALRLDSDGGSAELTARALVAQRTGEDWGGVRLTLSTANAQRWAELPELPSLRIGRRQQPPARGGWRPLPAGVEALYADWNRAFAGRVAESEEGSRPGAATAALAESSEEDALGEELPGLEAEALLEETLEEMEFGAADEAAPMARASPAMAPPPMPAPAAAMSLGTHKRRRSRGSVPRPLPGDLAEPAADLLQEPQAGPLRAREDMLAYGSLRMPSARSAERGSLVVSLRSRLYMELLIEQHVELRVDIDQAIHGALRRADSAGQELPERFRLAASDDGFDYAYLAEAPADIPSDGDYHSIPLATGSAACRLRHVCVPRESSDVFRVAETENPLAGPLLPGPVDVYLGDEFLVTAEVATTPAGAKLGIGLGADEAVKVSRNTRYREEVTGLTRGSLALAHEIVIETRNNLPRGIELEVRERIPTTLEDEEEIEVELGKISPPWSPYSPPPEPGGVALKGAYHWQLPLGAGEAQQLRAPYRVRISSKHELVGGNRREP